MALQIAVAGKGGTGKTTFASLAVKQLTLSGIKPILAVDADANANLNEALGINVEETISNILASLKNGTEPMPAGMTKDQYVEFKIYQSLAEGENVDLLSMGGPEGPGCYCYANNILRKFMESLAKNYAAVVADNEAGLEHLSRRTTQDVDFLFVISDASARGIRSAKRVKQLVDSIKLKIKKVLLVVTKVQEGSLKALSAEIEDTGMELIGTIPLDPLVFEYDLHGRPLTDLPEEAPAVAAVREILIKTGITKAPA
jgi:CO dehydrogenase maturation factor